MTKLNLSEIPTERVRSEVRKTVEDILKTNNYTVNACAALKAGENNFVSVVYRLTFGNKDEKAAKPSKLILKVAPQNESKRAQFSVRPAFLREIYVYNVVLPCFRQFEQSKGVTLENGGFIEYPKCYRTVDVAPEELVFLEDLCLREFRLIDKATEQLTIDHIRLCMQALGKYHAISFALKDQHPEKFKELTANLDEPFFSRSNKFIRSLFNKHWELTLAALSNEEDTHLKDKLVKLLEKEPFELLSDCVEMNAFTPANVIGYGDFWQNNTMFRHDQNGKPLSVAFMDFQSVRPSSPVMDIIYYIYVCTTKELRDVYYDDILKTYHDSLFDHIKKLGSHPEKLFPYKLMQKHLRKFGRYGLFMGSFMLPVITMESGKSVDLEAKCEDFENRNGIDGNMFASNASADRLNKRLRDMVADIVRLEYI